MHHTIQDAALSLWNGQRTRILCPFCRGGTSKEVTMLVSRKESGFVTAFCFRSSCGAREFLDSNGNGAIAVSKKTQGRPFLGAYTEVPKHVSDFLFKKYRIKTPPTWRWSEELQRVIIPMWDEERCQWGWVARGFKEFGFMGPKADIYYNNTYIGYSY